MNAMNRCALWGLILLTACLTGCSGDARMARLAGTWELDLKASESIVDQLLDGQLPEDLSLGQKLAAGAAKAVLKNKIREGVEKTGGPENYSMTLELQTDGTWHSVTDFPMAKGEKNGLWKVSKDSGDTMEVVFVSTDPRSRKTENFKTTVTMISEDRIRLTPPNMNGLEMELTFQLQPAK